MASEPAEQRTPLRGVQPDLVPRPHLEQCAPTSPGKAAERGSEEVAADEPEIQHSVSPKRAEAPTLTRGPVGKKPRRLNQYTLARQEIEQISKEAEEDKQEGSAITRQLRQDVESVSGDDPAYQPPAAPTTMGEKTAGEDAGEIVVAEGREAGFVAKGSKGEVHETLVSLLKAESSGFRQGYEALMGAFNARNQFGNPPLGLRCNTWDAPPDFLVGQAALKDDVGSPILSLVAYPGEHSDLAVRP